MNLRTCYQKQCAIDKLAATDVLDLEDRSTSDTGENELTNLGMSIQFNILITGLIVVEPIICVRKTRFLPQYAFCL